MPHRSEPGPTGDDDRHGFVDDRREFEDEGAMFDQSMDATWIAVHAAENLHEVHTASGVSLHMFWIAVHAA